MLSSHSEKLLPQFSLENLKEKKGFYVIFPETPESTYVYISQGEQVSKSQIGFLSTSLLFVVFVCLSVLGPCLSFRDVLRMSQILYSTARRVILWGGGSYLSKQRSHTSACLISHQRHQHCHCPSCHPSFSSSSSS